ncbi:MAG: sigma-70 family RNA polymerase sigma factor [Verrucomicrobia bacterium]|nr:MAG: sigma-70 family RNA polymerase sigma factor [Verrucomicrobiota bacterium]
MNERQSDFEWLQQFARAGNQNAFRDLVRRHIDLVFATAMRKVGDAGGAQEISQNVFTALARKAWRFAPDDSLPAWLHKTALLESKSWLRGELRRRRREQTAAELGTTMKTPEDQPAFNALVPLLDEALLSLRESDRTALLLRYYESRSLRDVGASLGVNDDTAQKRVATALEKLSQFFKRRGFKTATVAATTAALQHTASSASAATVTLVASGALQAAPPVLVGLAALLARVASLSKIQLTAVCLAVAAIPVAWQWHAQRHAAEASSRAQTQLADAQAEFTMLQSEVERLRESAARLDASFADANKSAAQRVEDLRKFEAWKEKIRGQLLAADYHWPDDSPFVRIPKSMLRQLTVHSPVSQPGVIKQEARELLGLTPQEREQVEAALRNHFTTMDELMSARLYETNRAELVYIPQTALASEVWGVPPLGEDAKSSVAALQSSLQAVLGDERWPLVAAQLRASGGDSLSRILNLGAGERGQELAAWIVEADGKLNLGFGWGDHTSSMSSGGVPLELYRPEVEPRSGRLPVDDYLHGFPETLTRPMLDWIRRQAAVRLGKKGDQ